MLLVCPDVASALCPLLECGPHPPQFVLDPPRMLLAGQLARVSPAVGCQEGDVDPAEVCEPLPQVALKLGIRGEGVGILLEGADLAHHPGDVSVEENGISLHDRRRCPRSISGGGGVCAYSYFVFESHPAINMRELFLVYFGVVELAVCSISSAPVLILLLLF